MTKTGDPQRVHIFLLEDDAGEAARLTRFLRDGGFESVDTVDAPRHLLQRLRRNKSSRGDTIYLLLLSDRLTDRETYEACYSVAAQTRSGEIGVAFLAGEAHACQKAASPARDQCREVAVDVIPRPGDEHDFVRRVGLSVTLQQERRCRQIREQTLETELAERKVMEARLKYLVDHDDLTGLPNRRRLEQALELAVIRSRNFQRTNALLCVDLDQFKLVNDTAGHSVGDRLLADIANKLRHRVDSNHLVARIGADEFAILLEHVTEHNALEFARFLRRELSSYRFDANDGFFQMPVSIGVAMNVPGEPISASEWLARADQACHLAKTQGRNTVYKFSSEDAQIKTLRSDAKWIPALRQALCDDNFFLVFQPVVDLAKRRISHYEALIRMRGANDEVYVPADFIPVAERMGLIHQIDLWVVEKVLDFLGSLPPEYNDISMSINLSGHAFQDPALLSLIRQKLDMMWLPASRVMFEITETAAVTNYSQTQRMVARLRALGCRFALDDFGSGFSSFSYIKNFPVDILKIDGGFISNLAEDPTDELLVRSMVDVAHSLGKKVVAEYVESGEILKKLENLQVDYVQGMHLGTPLPHLVDAGSYPPAREFHRGVLAGCGPGALFTGRAHKAAE